MKSKAPEPVRGPAPAESDRDRLIRLLASLLARRWWKAARLRERGATDPDRNPPPKRPAEA